MATRRDVLNRIPTTSKKYTLAGKLLELPRIELILRFGTLMLLWARDSSVLLSSHVLPGAALYNY